VRKGDDLEIGVSSRDRRRLRRRRPSHDARRMPEWPIAQPDSFKTFTESDRSRPPPSICVPPGESPAGGACL